MANQIRAHVQQSVRYQNFHIDKQQPLGHGSYGAVYKAKRDQLPCAAKILHQTILDPNDPGAGKIMQRFQQECTFLENIRHPNIVQYLGTTRDPESRLPVLLMELLEENLTKMLELAQRSLAYYIQVDICHDIALAVAYLHSNDIIHRDLSSNNVLIMSKSRAKVTDFGMSKLAGAAPSMTPLTMCPGTLVYMPPEALKDPPGYTEKLDCFSEGVIMIQVCTRLWPEPGPRTKTVPFPKSPTGMTEVPVLEPERRKNHIDMIDRGHGLLPIAMECLHYQEKKRPTSEELCQRLADLKETREYRESLEQIESVQNYIAKRERQMGEMQAREAATILQLRELCDKNQQQQGEILSNDTQLQQKERQLQQLQDEVYSQPIQQEREIQQLKQQLEGQEQVTTETQQTKYSLQQQVESRRILSNGHHSSSSASGSETKRRVHPAGSGGENLSGNGSDYIHDQQHIAKLVETGKEDTPVTIPDDNGVAVSGGSKGRSKGRKREEHTPVDDTSRLRRAKKEMESPQKVVASEDNVQSGLSIDGSHQVDHVGRLGQLSTLTEETPQSEDVRDRNIKINECSSLLVNGFNEEENLLNDELLEYEPEPLIEVPEEPLGRPRSGAISDAFTRCSADLAMLESPVSMSVPAQYHIHDYMSQASSRDRGNCGAALRDLESLLYEQSRDSGEMHPSKCHNVTPPSVRKQYNYSPSSTRKQHKDPSSAYGSLKSSGSTHIIDSLRNKFCSGKGAKGSSLERGVKLRESGGGSGKIYDGGAKRYSSPASSKYSPISPRRTPSSGHYRASSGSGSEMRRRVHPAGSGGENSSSSGRGSRWNSGSLRGSSDGTGIKGSSPLVLLKEDEPTYIHNNLNLYLNMEVFNLCRGEHFKMVFKSPVMQYGDILEVPCIVIFSDYKMYIFKIVGPESTNAQQWLELIAAHHLKKLVYIDHGVGHQYLRVEFSLDTACYTFLIRNGKKCTLCADMLARIVTDVPKSSFRTVGYPEQILREVIATRYKEIKNIHSGATPTSASSPSLQLHKHINPDSRPASSLADDDEMVLYRLVERVDSADKGNRVPLTLVLTKQTIYLGKENFAQWPLPKVQSLPKRDDLKPPFSNVIHKNISDVEQIVLDKDQRTYVSLQFFKELNEVSMSGHCRDNSKWSLIMQSAACVKKLVDMVKSRWNAQFEITLPVLRKIDSFDLI